MSKTTKVAIVSLGCSKNQVDAEQMMAKIADRGYAFVAEPGMADIVLVNTCGFIQSAKEEAIGWIMELIDLKNEGRIKRIVVTGCLSERYRDQFAEEFPEIDAVVGIAEYGKIADIIDGLADFEKPSHEEGTPAVCYFGRKESHSMEGKRIIPRFRTMRTSVSRTAATTAAPTALSRRYADASAAAGWRTSWRRRSFSRRTA